MLRYRGRIIITHLLKATVIVLKLIVEEYIIDVDFGPTDLSCKRKPATLKLKMLEHYGQPCFIAKIDIKIPVFINGDTAEQMLCYVKRIIVLKP